MRSLTRGEMIGVLALLAIVTAITGWTVVRAMVAASTPGITLREAFPQAPAAPPPVRPPGQEMAATSANAAMPAANTAGEIVVHVAGAVRKPGVYHLPLGARGEDALKAAGGPTANANTDAINLAARLEDGNQLYFPTRDEQPSGGAPSTPASKGAASSSPKASGRASAHSSRNSGGSDKPGKLTDPSQGKVNINTASADELQRLPGIGPAMAERILAYRQENHGFQRAEDLMQVSGIGSKKFAKLQPFVRVK